MQGAPHRLTSAALRQGLAGAAGGFLVFLLLEPGYRAAGWDERDVFGAADNVFVPGAVAGALITALLVIVDDVWSGRALGALRRALPSAVVGAVMGAGYSVIGHALFAVFALGGDGGLALLQAGTRAVSWAFFGLGVGLSAGLASRSMRRAYHGCAGGLIGGFAGGFLFSLAQMTSGSGSASRFAGFVALGACVGVATALVEQFSTFAWLTFLSGSREGRQVLIHNDAVVLGRDELADVPLMGDRQVDRRHAVLSLRPAPAIREVGAAALMCVQGAPVREAPLFDGALIEIGWHRFRFHQRRGASAPVPQPSPVAVSAMPDPLPPLPGPERDLPAAPRTEPTPESAWTPGHGLILRILSGAGAGLAVRLGDPGLTIGRDADNNLPLSDPKISRHHARIERIDSAWVLTDLRSTNGTRLNGLRVVRAGLCPGDFLYLGDMVLGIEPDVPTAPALDT